MIDDVTFNKDGLVPAIAQCAENGDVLMMAWMNREALTLTCTEGQAVYWSRSRQALWRKGERSGNQQQVSEVRLDCDADVVLLKVEQVGGIACHTGRPHCFFRRYTKGNWIAEGNVIKDPQELYGHE